MEVDELLLNVRLPEAVPLDCGVNFTLNAVLWPAASVSGREIPATVNSELFRVAEDTVTLDPLALSFPLNVSLASTTTLPKLKVVGLTANCPEAVPVPERGMFRVPFEGV